MISKVTVLMPTYNDEEYIYNSIQSVLSQKGVRIQLIVINDGSTDKTEKIVRSIEDERILLLNQENKGQLNALFHAVKYVEGDYVALFHSDDLITDENAFRRNIVFLEKTKSDGVYSDYIVIDANDDVQGKLSVEKILNNNTIKKLLIARGSNVVGDPFFVTKKAFFRNVVKNYIAWNMPYWLKITDKGPSAIKILYMKEPWYKYRVYIGNYVHSETGKFVASNGVIRTVSQLSKFFKAHFIFFRWVHRLPLFLTVKNRVLSTREYRLQMTGFLRRILKDYSIDLEKSYYHQCLYNYYSKDSKNTVKLDDSLVENAPLFLGKDARIFYKILQSGSLHPLYHTLLEAARHGRFKLEYSDQHHIKLSLILKFLNLVDL